MDQQHKKHILVELKAEGSENTSSAPSIAAARA